MKASLQEFSHTQLRDAIERWTNRRKGQGEGRLTGLIDASGVRGAALLALFAFLITLAIPAGGQDSQAQNISAPATPQNTALNGTGNVFLTANAYGTGGAGPLNFALADFNGDGKLDLAAANGGSNNIAISLGNGDGTFQAPIATAVPCNPVWVAAGDFNGDGKLDLAAVAPGCSAGTNGVAILLGKGDGTFTAKPTLASPIVNPVSAVVGDFNGDGKLDLAVVDRGSSGDLVYVYLGKGDGTFQTPTSVNLGVSAAANQIVAADFNKDSHLDLAVSFQNQAAVDIILGNGNGTFQAPRVLALPTGNGGYGIAIGDFNGDGVPDLVATTPNIGGISVFLGTGNGNFTPVNNPQSGTLPTAFGAIAFAGATSVAVGDFNKDGKLDVIVGLSGVNGAPSVAVLLGKGDGTLQPESLFGTADNPSFVAVADLNGDGNLDWVTNGNQTNYVVIGLGRGDGTFLATRNFTADVGPSGVAAVDFDKDGKLDLVVPNASSQDISILLGNGNGTFQPSVNIAFPALAPTEVVAGDFNNDGNPDFAVFSQWCPNFVNAPFFTYLGKGDGTFQAPVTTTLTGLSSCAAINSMVTGDFNGDGKLDVALGYNHDTGNPLIQILLGKGDGTFTPLAPFSTGGISFAGMVVGDLNKDGKLDLVATDFRQGLVKVFIGNGDGTFQAPTNIAAGRFPGGVVLGDFRGSGNLDIIVENELDGNAEIFPGNGTGTFNSGTIINTGGNPLQNILAGDFNLDGKLDFIGNEGTSATGQSAVRLFLGNGDGTFQAPQEYLAGRLRQVAIVADFNRDGAPDVLSLDAGEHFLTMFLNQTPPPITASPKSLTFGNQLVGTSSSTQPITVKNNGAAATTIGVSVSGDFTQTNACPVSPATLAVGATCTVNAAFKPSTTGPRNGTITITYSFPGSPQTVALTGTGVAPIVVLGGTSISFGGQVVGSTSGVQMVSLSNTGTAALTISSIAITGTNSGDFSQTNTCGGSVAINANCSISVTFKPTATGPRTASVTITDNANPSPQLVTLNGTGVAPIASVAPTNIPFGNHRKGTTSAGTDVTLSNTGTAALHVSSIALGGANPTQFTLGAPSSGTACSLSAAFSLTVGSNCKFSVKFAPTSLGPLAASVTITDDSGGTAGTMQSVSLSGAGTDPTASLSINGVNFGFIPKGTKSAVMSVTLTNTGTDTLNLAAANTAVISGTNAADFAIASGTTCTNGLQVAANGGSCLINLTFTPSTAAAEAGTLTITDDSGGIAGTTQIASLSGTGTQGIASLSTTTVAFGNVPVSSSSAPMTVTLTNTGNGILQMGNPAVSVTGTNAGDFAIVMGPGCLNLSTLGQNGSCGVSLTFTPATTGARSATLTFTDDSGGTPGATQKVSLTGTGTAASVKLSPSPVNFGNQQIFTTSGAMIVTLTNSGTASVKLAAANAVTITGTNASDFTIVAAAGTNCANSLVVAPNNGTCVIGVTFRPVGTGPRTATLQVNDNANPSPQSVTLNGTGTVPGASFAPQSLNFGIQLVGTSSAAQKVTLTNTGTAALTITSITITGANIGDFSEADTCPVSPLMLGVQANCVISVIFKPTTAGGRSASVTIMDDAQGSPQNVPLNGIGTPVNLSAASLNFTPQRVGTTSPAQIVTLTNSGVAPLTITLITITGANSGDFSQTPGSPACPISPATLAAGSNCKINVTFTPTAAGIRTATLQISDDAPKSPQTVSLTGIGGSPGGDFDGDGKADLAVFRPSTNTWWIIPSGSPRTTIQKVWGNTGDIMVPGDYDGDGITDIAAWRPSNGTWYVIPSSNPTTFTSQQWGMQGDIPVPGDYDGDGITDFAVWRPSTGTWYIIPSSNPSSPIIRRWGNPGDIPVPGDYDGDGITDFAVWRPSTGTWYIIPSSNPGTPIVKQWGLSTDLPVPGDYDGDGITDIAAWRPSTGTWYIVPSSNPTTFTSRQWGMTGDIPVPRDYDGDGKTDVAVWRPSDGTWYIIPSGNPGTPIVKQWGLSTDMPVQKPVGQ